MPAKLRAAGGSRCLVGTVVAAVSTVIVTTTFSAIGAKVRFTAPPLELGHVSGQRGFGVVSPATQQAPTNFGSTFSLAKGVSAAVALGLAAAAARAGARPSLVACMFRKRYGGGPVKKDPAAVYGPQYTGPIDFAIQRRGRLGFPKGGVQRVIPKLSGGSYEARKQMMRNLTTELIRHGRIRTTFARAKALRSFVDRMVVLAKRGDDLARREANEWMFEEKLVENLFKLAPERYADQKKDFTQLTRTMNRKGDNAEMAYIELV